MLKYPLLFLLAIYKRVVSPLLPPACRFEPTCSVYMMLAVKHRGAVRGVWLGLKRLSRCRPFGGQGWDPVPGVDEALQVPHCDPRSPFVPASDATSPTADARRAAAE